MDVENCESVENTKNNVNLLNLTSEGVNVDVNINEVNDACGGVRNSTGAKNAKNNVNLLNVINPDEAQIDVVNSSKNENIPGIAIEETNKVYDGTFDDDDVIVKKKSKRAIVDSASEDEHGSSTSKEAGKIVSVVEVDDVDNITDQRRKNTRRIAIQSDSDDDNSNEIEEITPHNKSFNDDVNKESVIYNTNDRGELIPEGAIDNDLQKSRLSALCDAESSDEEPSTFESKSPTQEATVKAKPYRRSKTVKNGTEKSKKMTGREAAELRKEIKSESQRMARESNVSLPYHKPKSHSLKEFLSRRSKLSSTIPANLKARPSVAIKMSAEQLAAISQKFEERERELKEFYKSESESESDGDADFVPPKIQDVSEKLEQKEDVNRIDATMNVTCVETTASEKVDEMFVDNEPSENAGLGEKVNLESPVKVVNEESAVDAVNGESVVGGVDESAAVEGACELEELPQDLAMATVGNTNCAFQSSMEYEFNLDGLEDENTSKELIGEDCGPKQTERLTVDNDIIAEIENFQSTESESAADRRLSRFELIKELSKKQPRLSGAPTDLIDLELGVTKPNEVMKLMERFIQHTAKKNIVHKHKVKLSIVSVSGGEICRETVAMNVDEGEVAVVEDKPGAKYQKLRGELQTQMAQRRSELWQQKINKDLHADDPYDGEKSDCGLDDDPLLDDEEEGEMTESSESEEELIEEAPEKSKPKSAFIDEEAEESDIEADDEMEDAVVEDELEEDVDKNESDGESRQSAVEESVSPKKTLKRIKAFSEDSDDDDDYVEGRGENDAAVLDSTLSVEDDDLPPNQQPANGGSPQRSITQSKSDLGFLTPVSYLTGLQNLNSGSKFLKDSPIVSPFRMPNEPSPLKENQWQPSLQKKLFTESESQSVEELAEMCSGQFPSPDANKNGATDEDLLAFCTGPFPSSLSSERNCLDEAAPTTQDLLDICSGKFTNAEPNKGAESQKDRAGKTGEFKSLDDDQDLIISQLLDEEELERFKKQFVSPVYSNTHRKIIPDGVEEVQAGGGVIDSDGDDDGNIGVKKKRRQKKLVFSDDENSDLEDDEDDEEIDLHDSDGEEDMPADNIGYDSEENEIELNPNKVSTGLKASDFFEEEAELSESEWGSADEDEKDLDTMEIELADTENYDENEMRRDIEKIHMRKMLDDDTREVKLLQELLLQDGELHGTGRQRQFRWKNIDSMGEEADKRDDDQEVFLDEEESEEQWRKRRHQREMFLKEQQQKSREHGDDDGLLANSQLLKMGQKAIQRSQNSQTSTPAEKAKPVVDDSPKVKQPFSLLSNKRGSFLSRSDQVLQKLAEITKVSTNAGGVGTAKNSRHFLFQTISAADKSGELQDKKRKATDGTPNAIKKLRLTNNFSPAGKSKSDRAKKLFGGNNW